MTNVIRGRFGAFTLGLVLSCVLAFLILNAARPATNASVGPSPQQGRSNLTRDPFRTKLAPPKSDSPAPYDEDDASSDPGGATVLLPCCAHSLVHLAPRRFPSRPGSATPWVFERSPALRKRILKKARPSFLPLI